MRALAALLVALALSVSCSGEPGGDVPAEIRGRISEVAGDPVSELFLDSGGRRYAVQIDPARDYGFDLNHLREHQRTGDPVVVRSEIRDGVAYATSIEDA